jgi:hypothetical protein
LFSQRKHQLDDKVAKPTIHVQQSWKKKTNSIWLCNYFIFGATNPYKKTNENQQQFLEDLVTSPC